MTTQSETKPSLAELAIKSNSAIVMGVGGGGDVIQAIAVANYLSLLGVEHIAVGGVSCQWWNDKGAVISSKDDWGQFILGPIMFNVDDLTDIEYWAPQIVGVKKTSNVSGNFPCESAIRDLLPWDTFIAGLSDGVVGLRDSLRQVIFERKVDLFIGVDIGSDSLHDGHEVSPPASSLVDFMSISAMIQLDCQVVYGLSGYGCDGEMELDELDDRVSRIMKAGGYLGAHGLTQQDTEQMLEACHMFPDPIEPFAPLAAKGEFGLRKIEVVNPWGRRIRVTPLASIIMFFDPHTLVETVSTGVKHLNETISFSEAESVFKEVIGHYPETWMKTVVDYVRHA